MNVGDKIAVLDTEYSSWVMTGEILELDEHPFADSFALIRVDSPMQPPPEIWVDIRLAKIVAPKDSPEGKET